MNRIITIIIALVLLFVSACSNSPTAEEVAQALIDLENAPATTDAPTETDTLLSISQVYETVLDNFNYAPLAECVSESNDLDAMVISMAASDYSRMVDECELDLRDKLFNDFLVDFTREESLCIAADLSRNTLINILEGTDDALVDGLLDVIHCI